MENKKSRKKNPPTKKEIELANKLRTKRLENNLSLQEVADKLGISKVTVSRYETLDITNIPSDKIEGMAKLYNTTPAFLMGWERKKEEKDIFSQLTEEELAKLEKFNNMSTVMFMNEGNDISDKDKETLAIAYAEVLISQRKK
ncbi:helix-turn-helix transcriptional regulator [Fusobacterium animalis]|uniref:helix-turn-helix domain-containing protein n=1 Tax=Fusobacterium animalis TaxID=76859 RepID=UPI0030CFE740